ncbi:MAG TPA: M1 family metallopeptidase [Gemmatimonadales bacterium]|nr:M1 family metallopeptidase [Gemmatimonadales bacterium]
MLSLILCLAAGDSSYWQQRVAYEISASLDESSGVLSGRARIVYVNQSPDTLRDFYVHQYLNAFRPGSRWAAADSAEGRVRFQNMKDPDYAFERITTATVMGRSAKPDYPYAPDSTIAHWALPRPLAPGDSLVAEIDWQARPSTLPRRQGRQGRRFDFAQWYPKVVVYDKYGWQDHPLYPAGEFYGEFASYDVTLDLAADQVIGATGVPIEGDPGWERASSQPMRIDYQREYYHAPRTTHLAPCTAAQGRKCVRFYADSVHHFAFSLNPDYRYEQGRYKDVVVRVLYQPGDSATWGKGIAVQRTEIALMWLDSLFGKFAWPQITNLHRIEGGGTEFPMVIMDGSPGQGLIVHELGHNYTMGILANNEWREGWLDEGFTTFQTDWFFEANGRGSQFPDIEPYILLSDIDRWSEPTSMVSDRYRDFDTYDDMAYYKGALFLRQVRYVVGDDAMRKILRTYYQRWRLKHVDETTFREVVEDVSQMDLKWLFGQWLHATPLIDYQLDRVQRRRQADGRWLTTVSISRKGDGWMPIEVGADSTVYARASGQAEHEEVQFVTNHKPGRIVLDPRILAHDWNALNNREPVGIWPVRSRGTGATRFDNPTRNPTRRDRWVRGLLPLAWFNDYGGATAALRSRENYLGRFAKNLTLLSYGFEPNATNPFGFYTRLGNPVSNPMPRTDASVAGWYVEGRGGVALHGDRSLRKHQSFGADHHVGFDAIWMAVSDLGYVDRSLWDNAGTVEGGPWWSVTQRRGQTTWRARTGVRGGFAYSNPGPGVAASKRYDLEVFGRATAEGSVRTPFILKSTAGVRVFGGGYLASNDPPLQRRIMLSGADPYETFTNPLLRSRGALFVRPDFHYHAPGNANLRGFSPDLGGRWAAAANFEATKALGLPEHAALELFFDAGFVDASTLYDGGVGLVTRHRINELEWTMRFEMPLLVSHQDLAAMGTTDRLAFRWQFSLEPSF